MSVSETVIFDALSSYRAHIGNVNHRAFSAMVPRIEAAEPDDPDLFESIEEVEEARLDFTLSLVGAPPPPAGPGYNPHGPGTRPPLRRPLDVLTYWGEVAPQLALDGGAVHFDHAWRDAMREIYKRGIMRGLNERCGAIPGDTTAAWQFPADLDVIMRHVDSLEGPGWRKYRQERGMAVFFDGWIRDGGGPGEMLTEERVGERVRTAQEIANDVQRLDEEFEIAGGWACGLKGSESACYAVYVRPKVEGENEKRDWSWCYVANLGQFGTRLFRDAVEMLEWYTSYSEPSEEDWEAAVSAEELFY